MVSLYHGSWERDALEIYTPEKPGVEIRRFQHIRDQLFIREHQDMIEAIREDRAPRVTGEAGLKSLEVAERLVERIKEEKPECT